MANGYGESAPYGELQYKGETIIVKDYAEDGVSLLIEQYRKDYDNG